MTPIESFSDRMKENPDLLDLQIEPEADVYDMVARMWDRVYKYPVIIRTKISREFIEIASTFEVMELFFAIANEATRENPPPRIYKPTADKVKWVDDPV